MTFSKVQGQKRACGLLERMLSSERTSSALLFSGMEGIGKALLARQFAQALLCLERAALAPCGLCANCAAIEKGNHHDVCSVNAQYQASLREEEAAKQKTLRVETIRHLRKDMEMQSVLGGWKIAIIEDAHTLETEAANALLKILEEPNPGILWILLTSQRERLPKTIVSRCFSIPFTPLAPQMVRQILIAQGIAPARAEELAVFCEGSVSRALELAAGNYPDSLTAGGLAPIEAADSLPKELYLARVQAELAIFALAQDIRLKRFKNNFPFSKVERPLQQLGELRKALKSNADPRTILMLACVEAEMALS